MDASPWHSPCPPSLVWPHPDRASLKIASRRPACTEPPSGPEITALAGLGGEPLCDYVLREGQKKLWHRECQLSPATPRPSALGSFQVMEARPLHNHSALSFEHVSMSLSGNGPSPLHPEGPLSTTDPFGAPGCPNSRLQGP